MLVAFETANRQNTLVDQYSESRHLLSKFILVNVLHCDSVTRETKSGKWWHTTDESAMNMLMGSITTHVTYCRTHSSNQQFTKTLEASILENVIWSLLSSSCPLDFKWIYRKTQQFNTSIPANSMSCYTVCKWTIWQTNFQLLFDRMKWNCSLQCLTQSASVVYVEEYSVVSSLLLSRRLWTFQGPFQCVICAPFPAWTYHLPEFNHRAFTAAITVTTTIWEICCMLQPQCRGDAIPSRWYREWRGTNCITALLST